MLIYIVIITITLFLLTTVKLSILNVVDKTDVKIKFGILFYIHLDYEAFIQFFSIYRDENKKISLQAFYHNLNFLFTERKIIKEFAKSTYITNFLLISKNNAQNPIIESYINSTSLIMFSLIKAFLENNFKNVKNEVYQIRLEDKSLNNIDYDFDYKIDIKVRVYAFLYILIINFKDIMKFVKYQRGVKKNGTSN